jgi:hypothetical protein
MKQEDWQRLYEGFETRDLLDAVDHIDEVRYNIRNHDNGGPPELRTDLLTLHGLAMEVVSGANLSGADEMFDLADDLSLQISTLTSSLEKVQDILDRLLDLRPEFSDDDLEDAEES